MKQRYSFAQVVASWTPEKRAADGPWTRYVLRPLSFPVAWFFLAIGWSANAVTWAGAVFCIAGFFPLAFGKGIAVYIGLGLFFLFGIFDCADGNMARTRGKGSPGGEWADATAGYIAYTAILLGLGAVTMDPLWILAAGLAASANLLMRLSFQMYRATAKEEARKTMGGEKKFSEIIGITGILVPASAICYYFDVLPWLIVAYMAIYGGGAVVTIAKLIRKVETQNHAES